MTCDDVQKVLPEMLDKGLDGEFQSHLKVCPACSELVSDLQLICSEARQLSESDEPASRVWVRIAADLRSEGIIREPEATPTRPVLVPAQPRRWNAWWLVPVAAALLVAGSYLVNHKPASQQVAGQKPPAVTPATETPAVKAPVSQQPAPQQVVARKTPQTNELRETDSTYSAPFRTVGTAEDDEQFLNTVGQRSPTMRAAYESQLRAVNSYIRDAEAYLKKHPDDEDARQHLMDAYEQKDMLYQLALDRVQ